MRRIASGFALAFEITAIGVPYDLSGQKTIPIERLSFVEQALGKALNQQITLEAGPAYQAFEQAFASISKTRQDSLLVGLVMNGLAASATRANKAARVFLCGNNLQPVRPLQLKSLTQLINGHLIESYLGRQARSGTS